MSPKTSVYFHVDLDAFYASVEQADDQTLCGKPVIVGARPGSRGVVSACSYEARRFGVHSAMPISEAYRRCPGGVYLPVRMKRYAEVSKKIMTTLREYTPEFHQISIDEASMDMTGTERLFGPARRVAEEMKERIRQQTTLTMSIGIAPNRYLAKLASEYDKPDGVCLIENGSEESFLDGLELRDLWGVGGKTLDRLSRLGIAAVPELRSYSRKRLAGLIGDGSAAYLYRAVRGADPGIHPVTPKSRSISSETTFASDRSDAEGIGEAVLRLCHEVAGRLIREKQSSRTVCLKLRYSDFTTKTVRRTLDHAVVSTDELYCVATELLEQRWDHRTSLRLVGVGVVNVRPNTELDQPELFDRGFDRQRRVEETVARLEDRLAKVKVTRARLLGPKSRPR